MEDCPNSGNNIGFFETQYRCSGQVLLLPIVVFDSDLAQLLLLRFIGLDLLQLSLDQLGKKRGHDLGLHSEVLTMVCLLLQPELLVNELEYSVEDHVHF